MLFLSLSTATISIKLPATGPLGLPRMQIVINNGAFWLQPSCPSFLPSFLPPSVAEHPLGGLQVCDHPEGAHNSWGTYPFSPRLRHSSLFGRLFPVISSRRTSSFNPNLTLLLLIQDRDLRPSRSDISNPKNNISLVNRGISLSLSLQIPQMRLHKSLLLLGRKKKKIPPH